jgi:hypothetical protein
MLYALGIGGLLAQAAWTTNFLPLEGSGAAVFLLLAFYLMTGLMHNYLGDRLTRKTAAEFGGVAGLGVLIIILSHITN